MSTAYIVELSAPPGTARRALAGVHPVDLMAHSLDAIVERSGIDPSAIDDVVTGCVSQAGEQAMQVGRMGVLAEQAAAAVHARRHQSTASAAHPAGDPVRRASRDERHAGTWVIASGVESMKPSAEGSNVTLHMKEGLYSIGSRGSRRSSRAQFSQFMGAEIIVKKHGFTKDILIVSRSPATKRRLPATKTGAFDGRNRAGGDR